MSTRTSRRSSSSESHSSRLSFLDRVPGDSPSPTKSVSPKKNGQQGPSPINSPSKRVRSSSYGEVLEKARNSPEASSSNYRRTGYTLGTHQSRNGQSPKSRLTKHASFERSDDQHPLDLGGIHEERREQKPGLTSDPFVGPSSLRERLQKTRADTPPPYATIRPRRPIPRPYADPYREYTNGPKSPRMSAFNDDTPNAPKTKLFKHADDRLRAAQQLIEFADERYRGEAAVKGLKSLLSVTSKDEDEFFRFVSAATYDALDQLKLAEFERKERAQKAIEAKKFYFFGKTLGEWFWEGMQILWHSLLFGFTCFLFWLGWYLVTSIRSQSQSDSSLRHYADKGPA